MQGSADGARPAASDCTFHTYHKPASERRTPQDAPEIEPPEAAVDESVTAVISVTVMVTVAPWRVRSSFLEDMECSWKCGGRTPHVPLIDLQIPARPQRSQPSQQSPAIPTSRTERLAVGLTCAELFGARNRTRCPCVNAPAAWRAAMGQVMDVRGGGGRQRGGRGRMGRSGRAWVWVSASRARVSSNEMKTHAHYWLNKKPIKEKAPHGVALLSILGRPRATRALQNERF